MEWELTRENTEARYIQLVNRKEFTVSRTRSDSLEVGQEVAVSK